MKRKKHIKPVPFNQADDTAPMPFDIRHLRLAEKLKRSGLPFHPHVGCFVWDPEGHVPTQSPFPERVYFILSLPRFIDIFGSLERIAADLVWLPTWHQARLLCERRGVPADRIALIWNREPAPPPGEELLRIYELLLGMLSDGA
jgi:hypothetical protein